MRRDSRVGFVFPFTLGTVLGIVSGAALGALVGRKVITFLVQSVRRHREDSPRFDLLMQ